VVQSLMQATGQAVPQAWQMCAVSVSPPPVSTSAQPVSDEPQSGQTGSWKMTRKLTARHQQVWGCAGR
jgi:hypothetical protein